MAVDSICVQIHTICNLLNAFRIFYLYLVKNLGLNAADILAIPVKHVPTPLHSDHWDLVL